MNQFDSSSTRESRDRDLVELLAADLSGNFELLVLAYQSNLYAFAQYIVRSEQDAEDITQDTFVKAYNSLKGMSPSRIQALKLRSWLFTIAYHLSLNHNRNKARSQRSQSFSELGEPVELIKQDPVSSPEQVLEEQESYTELVTYLRRLQEPYRTATILHYIIGLEYAEIATILSQPLNTVKSNGRRGLQILQKLVRNTEGSKRR
jgi:RNA polymerase sigma-70 factor, ECF subfamily